MKYVFYTLLFSFFTACQSTENNIPSEQKKEIDNTLSSLYPLQDKWLELQNLNWDEKGSNQRNFKNSSNFKTLQHEIFETFCIDEACYQINESLQLEKISEQGSATKKAEGSANNFFFPISNAWIVATSLPTENLFTIKKLNVELQEQWQIIYEKSRLDTLGKMIQYSNVLGYNDHILIFNSNIDQIRKSGFIDLENGIKKQAEYQWTSVIIDEDERTVLGQLVQNEDLSYQLQLGGKTIDLPSSISGFQRTETLVSGNQIFLSFYFTKSDIVKTFALDYHSGDILWDNSIISAKTITDIHLSTFDHQFLLEIISSVSSSLHVFQKSDGKLLDKF